MFEKEKEKLESQINEKTSKLKEINEEQQEIEERKTIIKNYESAEHSIKFCKKLLKGVGIIILVTALFIIMLVEPITIDVIDAIFVTTIVSVLGTAMFGGESIIDAFKAKKVIKEITTEKYDELKQNEEKDKQLELSLSNEYAKVEQEQIPLKYKLSWLKKNDALQKIGYQLELSMSNFELQELCVLDNRNKKACEQLWEQYLEEKEDYSKIHLYSNEVDSTIKLVKKV